MRRRRLDSEPHKRPIESLDRAVEDVHAEWTYELELSTDEALPDELAQLLLDLAARSQRNPAATNL